MNLKLFVSDNFDNYSQILFTSCCKIYCNTSNALLDALKCQGASNAEAINIWICFMSVIFLSFLHLLGGFRPELSLKLRITTMGGLAFKSGLTSYFLVIFSGPYVDTILYPIVTAMDFAILSYFFSGFQYAIGIGTEATAVILLSFTIFPLYHKLAFSQFIIYDTDSPPVYGMRAKALVMLSLALGWALHSAVYRTISYRAHWIAAWKKQTAQEPTTGKHHMSGLWFLAAAQGQPTWHTNIGQSVGLVMLILAWTIVGQCREFLKQNCTDDFILFQIMLYVPPILLTLAMLSTEIHLLSTEIHLLFAGFDSMTTEGHKSQGFWEDLKRTCICFNEGPSQDDFIKATVAYMLGRNSLYVELELNADFENFLDKYIGHTVWSLQHGLNLLCYIPCVIIRIFNICILKVLCTFSKMLHSNTEHESFDFKVWLDKKKPSDKEKERAYEILIKCCGPVDNLPKGKAEKYVEKEREEFIEDILEKNQSMINLPLLLDGSVPRGLLYLLIILDKKLEAKTRPDPHQRELQNLNTHV